MDDGLNALWIKLFLFSKTRAESTDLATWPFPHTK
jgi:hypothetical protein